jgi:hypothetical protein
MKLRDVGRQALVDTVLVSGAAEAPKQLEALTGHIRKEDAIPDEHDHKDAPADEQQQAAAAQFPRRILQAVVEDEYNPAPPQQLPPRWTNRQPTHWQES